MSVSIQELDNTVRAFYEGKGDVVSLYEKPPQTPQHADDISTI